MRLGSKLSIALSAGIAVAGLAIPVVAMAPPAGAATGVYVAPTSIASDCSVDVTAALLAWLNTVPSGTQAAPVTAQLAPNGCYHVDDPFTLPPRNWWTFDGNNATIRRFTEGLHQAQYPKGYAHFELNYSSNLTVKNTHIMGTNTVSDVTVGFQPPNFGVGFSYADEFESGFHFEGDTNLTVVNNTTDATFGDGITLGSEHPDSTNYNVTVTNDFFDRNGRQGIGVGASNGLVISSVYILHGHANGINMEMAGDAQALNLEIKNSYINTRAVAISMGGIANVANINIHNNTIRYASPSWPWVAEGNNPYNCCQRLNWTVTDNNAMMATDSAPFEFDHTTNVTVKNNTAPVNGSSNQYVTKYPGVNLNNDAGTILISGNDFSGGANGAGSAYMASPAIPVTACNNKLTLQSSWGQPPC